MSLVALILGSGANIGKSVAIKLKEQGYKVAVGSRNPQAEEGFYPIKVDVTDPTSVSQAFEEVDKALGAPNVVIFAFFIFLPLQSLSHLFIAASHVLPTISGDPLSISLESFTGATNLVTGVFTASQEAVKRFKTHSGPKVFITTGNILPFAPRTSPALVLGSQKIAEAYFSELFYNAYAKDGIRFHFAHVVGNDGGSPPYPDFAKSGPAHAKAYWDLISSVEPKRWNYRFTLDGEVYPNY